MSLRGRRPWQSPGRMCELGRSTWRFPRGFAPRNDSGGLWLVLLLCSGNGPGWSAWAVPHALQNWFFLKKCLHFPNIRARISIVNIKSVDRVVVFSAHARREGCIGGSSSAWKTGLSPGSCRLKSKETRVRRCDRRYRVEGVSAPDRVRRKANAGGTAEDFDRSFVPNLRGRKAVFSFPLPPSQREGDRASGGGSVLLLIRHSPSQLTLTAPSERGPRNRNIIFQKERFNP